MGGKKRSRDGFSFVLVTELLRSSSHKSFRGNSYSVIRNCFPLIYDLVRLLGKLCELSGPERNTAGGLSPYKRMLAVDI